MTLSIRRMWFSAALSVCVLGTAGCGLSRGYFGDEIAENGDLFLPTVATNREPRIRPGMLLRIEVASAGQAQVEVNSKEVSARGEILMPMIGAIACEGLTIRELQQKMVLAYAEYVHHPQVMVSFIYTADSVSPWGVVRVMGQVARPGPVNIPPTQDLTVLRAIQMAGGATVLAARSGVEVIRTLPDGSTRRIKVDLNRIGKEGLWKLDIRLEPDDVVFVPESII